MGQNNSRSSPQHIPPAPPSSSASSPPVTAATTSTVNEQSTVFSSPTSQMNVSPSSDTLPGHSQPQRSSVHQSILNLVKRRTTPSDTDVSRSTPNGSASSSNSSKRRWRSCRRWSKAPAIPDSPQSEIDTNMPPSDLVSASASSDQSTDKGKGKEKDAGINPISSHADPANVLPEPATSNASTDRPSTPYPHSLMHPTLDTDSGSSPWSGSTSQGVNSSPSEDLSDVGLTSGSQARPQYPLSESQEPTLLPSGTVTGVTNQSTVSGDFNRSAGLSTTTHANNLSPSFDVPPGLIPSTAPGSVEPTATPLPTRQFPPPGTLVVVQGVVHTTDVPPPSTPPPRYETPSRSTPSLHQLGIRRRASSTPRPSTPTLPERTNAGSSTRHRLSALIPRSRVPSTLTSSSSDTVAPGSNAADNTSTSITGSDDTIDNGSRPDPAQNTSTRNPEGRDNDSRGATPSGPISSSSIEVLGTLLSVAAFATAQSLLTGSSEPIFNSGLPQRNNDHPSSPSPNFMRPTSPTPTAGFGGLPFGLGGADSDMTPGQESATTRGRDRVRHAWGSLRERLGLRGTNQNTNGSGNDPNTPNRLRPDGTPMDAREVMLAEMARAFNLGLGLGSEGAGEGSFSRTGHEISDRDRNRPSSDGSDSPTMSNNSLGRPSPSEDFDRFLMDLQSELRVVLSQPANGGDENTLHLPTIQPSASVATSTTIPPPTSPTSAHIPSDMGDEQMSTLENVSDAEVEDSNDVEDDDPVTPTADSDMPPLVSDTPTSSIFPFPPSPTLPQEAAASTTETTPGPTPASSTHRTEPRPAGGINWWRLYRFPPITSPHPQGVPAPFTNTGLTGSRTPASDSMSLGGGIAAAASTETPTPSTASDERPNSVIPVIVVGLQSVNPNGRRQEQASGDNEETGSRDADSNDNVEDDVDFDGFPPEADFGNGEPQQRGRRWHSRAADVIRNLRPGRRNIQGRNSTNEGTGSRTFLIYVIGGYYPPDHHIVTGASTLDSFEALWELAELLGQVKPPTATREEIDRSGLEVVQPSVLADYEKEGKVASNCIEKCLICLDEYVPTDDVRLLSCRHAFHKNCVDKWLQTGRNNCPACRSKGVSTEDVPNMYPSAV